MTPNSKPISKRLFVGSLPYDTTEGTLLSLFITEGKVVSIKVIKNRWNRSRGMAYVEYENVNDAVRAKQKYHGYRIDERTIIVDYAEPDPYNTPEGKARHEEALDQRYKGRHQNAFEYNTGEKISKNANVPSNTAGIIPRARKPLVKGTWKPTRRGGSSAKLAAKNDERNKLNDPSHVRQTIYESRNFGSKVGAKFASKNRNKRNK